MSLQASLSCVEKGSRITFNHIKKFVKLCYYIAAGTDYVNINVLILCEILLQNACIFFSKLATQFSSLV